METIFDKKTYDSIAARIEKLTPSTQRVWGKMNVGQMMAHCCGALSMATGEKKLPRLLIGRILGPLVKPGFLSEKPLSKGSPTAKEFIFTDERDFEKEKKELHRLLKKFHEGGEKGATPHPHGFFGHLTPKQWGEVQWKHLDHHLKQFGV
ncbi:MAG TPA: DUF1569 domain-containing protein [Bacteroidia bacterium]|jgi:hypothetical protein|nr:DUF1569 domain-containing protein [Bacteroidia bacterium]